MRFEYLIPPLGVLGLMCNLVKDLIMHFHTDANDSLQSFITQLEMRAPVNVRDNFRLN
jgi:hypothetical protein